MHKVFLFVLVSVFWGWVMTPVAFAETEEGSNVYTLGEIVVSAEREGVEAIGTVREITAEEIETQGARTLDEALELLPGVNIRTGADGVPRVDLRGFRSRHVVLLLDGIPLNSTFDGQFDPSLIPVENIAKIKVSYGDHSVLYGDGGLGGVINIITKKGTEAIHGMASGEAGEGDSYLGKFDFSGGYKKADYFFSGSLYKRNGFPLSDDFQPTTEQDGGLRENSDKKRNNFFANVNLTPNDEVMLGAIFSYSNGNYGKPPSTINDSKDLFADNPKFERVDDFENYSTQLSCNYDVPGPFDVRSWVFFNQLEEEENRYDDNKYDSMEDPTVKGTFHQNSTTRSKGIAIQPKYDLKSFGYMAAGLNARREEYESEGRIRDVKLSGGQFGVRDFHNENDLKVYSASLEYEVSPFRKTLLVVGYSHYWLEKDRGEDDNAGSFLVGAYYDISDKTRIRGSFARKIRFPSIRQLYEEVSGNPDLSTEKSNNYELGVEQKLPLDSKVSLTAFLIDVKDYIEKDDVTETFENNEKYRFQGFELTAETRFVKNLLLGLGYSYLDTEDGSPNTEKEELQYRPKHKLTFEGKYYFNFGLLAYMDVIYIADQYFYSKKAPLQKKKMNDYTLVNIKLDQALIHDRLHLYLGADNLFDADYEESYGYPQAGRFIYGGLTVSL